MQRIPIGKTFDGEDFSVLDSDCQDEAGIHGHSINEDRAGTAFSSTTPLLGPCEIESVSQHLQQGFPRFHLKRIGFTIDLEGYRVSFHVFSLSGKGPSCPGLEQERSFT